jgi:pimeloyl-ACP methyl ester carboxylesterase
MMPAEFPVPAHVIFVHGLFMTGAESVRLRSHLTQDLGAQARAFRYSAGAESLDEGADRLAHELAPLAAQGATVHLVGHSLGGLLLLRLFERAAAWAETTDAARRALPTGRIVLLGSPVCGSRAAAAVRRRVPFGAQLLGRNGAALEAAARRWPHAHELGIIAGTRPAGLGRFFARFDEPNDGTVALSETALDGATDRIALPVSHMGMLWSRAVSRETAHFLHHGRFSLVASA